MLWSSILLFLILPIIYRISIDSNLDYDLYYRKIVLSRFDSIGYGLLFSFFHFYYKEFWEKYKNLLFVLGVVLIFSIENISVDVWYYRKIIKFCLLSFSISLLLPYLSSVRKILFLKKTIAFLSEMSFSVYLLHMPVSYILLKYFKVDNLEDSLIYLFMYLCFTISLAYINHKVTEDYFMGIRRRVLLKVDGMWVKKTYNLK